MEKVDKDKNKHLDIDEITSMMVGVGEQGKNDKKVEKIRQEIKSRFGDREISYDEFKQLIKEKGWQK